MRKFFTFVILALVAVSVWGAEVTIGGSGSNDTNVPISLGFTYSASQSIYTAAELTDAGIPANANISKISFKYAVTTELTRSIKVYITNRTSDVAQSHMSTSYKFDKVTSSDLFYDGTITTPTTSATFYDIPLSKNFVWDGTSNICIIVCDNTGSTGAAYKSHKASNVSSTPGRCIYSTGNQINPTSSFTNTGSNSDYRPVIKITYSTGTGPVTTPTITTSTDALNFGTCYPEYEDAIKTFTVKASDLSDKITITSPTGVVVSPTEIAKDEAALAGDGVTVTAQITKDFTFPSQAPSITIASKDATSKTVKVNATEGTFAEPIATTYFKPDNENVVNHNGYVSYTAGKLTIFEVANNQFKPYNGATFKVDYSDINTACADGGKVTNLRGKFISNDVFKAFSFDYEAPEQTGIVIDENNDNYDEWPENAESGKDLIIKRTIVPNEWNSIVLPTHLTSTEVSQYFGEGTDVEKFTNAVITSSNITLNFTKETNGLEAGFPYLIKPTQALPNPLNLTNHSFKKTVTPVDNNGIEFVGVLVPTDIDGSGDDYIFVGANNTLFHPEGAGTIKGMRAYFHVVDETAKAAIKKSPMISLSTGSTTAMTLVKPDANKAYKAIENGRIVIKANGKKVNVLGQTVK